MADNSYDDLYNSDVVDTDGNKIGGVGQVYLDDKTGLPSWVTVKTGLFGTKETFVPLDMAMITGDQIRVPYTEDFVKAAPNVEPDRHLEADEEARLYDYYGISVVAAGTDSSAPQAAINEPQTSPELDVTASDGQFPDDNLRPEPVVVREDDERI